jgi:5,10-methylenetetrahydromethanopterin reductase
LGPGVTNPFTRRLEDDFIERFALVGTADEVVARLAELPALGVQRIVVVPGSIDADPSVVAESDARFAEKVLRRLGRRGSGPG